MHLRVLLMVVGESSSTDLQWSDGARWTVEVGHLSDQQCKVVYKVGRLTPKASPFYALSGACSAYGLLPLQCPCHENAHPGIYCVVS